MCVLVCVQMRDFDSSLLKAADLRYRFSFYLSFRDSPSHQIDHEAAQRGPETGCFALQAPDLRRQRKQVSHLPEPHGSQLQGDGKRRVCRDGVRDTPLPWP